MVAFSGFVHPTNKVIVQGKPEVLDRTAEEAGIKPGMVVMAGTTQDLCKIHDFTKGALGFAGYEQASEPNFDTTNIYGRNKPEGLTAAYASGAKVPVLYLANFVLLAYMYAGSAANKGDMLAAFSGGRLVAGKMTQDGFAVRLPFVKHTAETSTGFVVPSGAVINDVYVEVSTAVASSTIDVGLLSTEVGGNADGFLDGESCAATGRVQHHNGDATAANNTLGAFLTLATIKDATSPANYYAVPKRHVGDGTAKTITYTTSNDTIAGNIFVVFDGLEVVAKSVEEVASGAAVLVEALI
jgi:hypothetical protein